MNSRQPATPVTYQLATAGWDNTPILTCTEKLSKLVSKRLTLSYVPASQADADLIASYLPKDLTSWPTQLTNAPS